MIEGRNDALKVFDDLRKNGSGVSRSEARIRQNN